MTIEATATRPHVDVARAARDAVFAAVLAFGLFLPLIGFKTVQNIRNELVLETRYGTLFVFVAIIAAASLFRSLVIDPWKQRRTRQPRKETTAPSEFTQIGRGLLKWIGYGLLLIGIVSLGFRIVTLIPLLAAPSFLDGIVWLSAVVLSLFVAGIGFVLVRSGRQGFAGAASLLGPAGIGFLMVFPILIMTGVGLGGAVKWIDNFGIQILIYVMLGFGLNIVVGLAGLLDLGYVAFYAVGAYSYALLAKTFGLSFYLLLPLAGILASFWGIMLGFPVLRLRGDYLAIVTLAFGEIIRIVLINWVPVTNGYAGIGGIPRPTFFGFPFTAADNGFAAAFHLSFSPVYRTIWLYYIILALTLLTALVTTRLRRLPIGRAWEALREDETACRSLGINTTTTKLTAFATGALFGGFAGAFFAARQGFVSPESFTFMESATILVIVVLGGMGSQIGVALAAVVMVGGTEILRDLEFLKRVFGDDFDPNQYRMLLFGFAMVAITVWKPRGFVGTRQPSIALGAREAIGAEHAKESAG
jgi:branched-chain amino acid transport system permease protein